MPSEEIRRRLWFVRGTVCTVQLWFRRLSDDGLHAVRIVRDDGVVLAIESRNRAGSIPHDLGHFVGERAFGVEDGFWGSIAEGALFRSVRVVEGKLRHDATARSKAILKKNAAGLLLGEVVGGPCHRAVELGLDTETAYKDLVRTWGSIRTTPMPYDRRTVSAAIMAFAETRDAWRAVAVGDELPLVWTTRSRRR